MTSVDAATMATLSAALVIGAVACWAVVRREAARRQRDFESSKWPHAARWQDTVPFTE